VDDQLGPFDLPEPERPASMAPDDEVDDLLTPEPEIASGVAVR
jgi:hypothetical protein